MSTKIKLEGDVSGILDSFSEIIKASDSVDDAFEKMDKLKKAAFNSPDDKAFKKSINDVVKGSDKAAESLKKQEKGISKVGKEFKSGVKDVRSWSDAVQLGKNTAGNLTKSLFTIPKGMGAAAKGARLLKVALIAIPIFAIVTAIATLVAVFTKSQAGAEKLERVMSGLSAVLNVAIDRAIAFGNALLNFKSGGINGIKDAFKGIGDEVLRGFKLAQDLKGELQKIEKAEILDAAAKAKSKARYEELKLLAEDRNRSLVDRIANLKEAEKIEQRNLDNSLNTTKELIKNQLGFKFGDPKGAEALNGALAIIGENYANIADKAFIADLVTKQIGISSSQLDDFDLLVERITKVYELREESAGRQASLITQVQGYQEEAAAKLREQEKQRQAAIEAQRKIQEQLYDFINGKINEADDKDKGAREKQVERVNKLKDSVVQAYAELQKLSASLDVTLDISQDDIDRLLASIDSELHDTDVAVEIPTVVGEVTGDDSFNKAIDEMKAKADDIDFWEKLSSDKLTLAERLGLSDEELATVTEGLKAIYDSLGEFADLYIEQQQVIIDTSNERITQLESDITDEQALEDQNINNNLQSKQDELKKETAIRDAAIKEQQKAKKVQFALDTATQASGLITSSVNIFKSLSNLGPIGVAGAIATIATMLGSFAAVKVKAYNLIKAKKGLSAKLTDRSHSNGGEHLIRKDGVSTGIEAEKGEGISVFSKSATAKNWPMIQDFTSAVNDGKLVSINTGVSEKRIKEASINMGSAVIVNLDLSSTNSLIAKQNKLIEKNVNRNKITRRAV